jgi:hypothetical protein
MRNFTPLFITIVITFITVPAYPQKTTRTLEKRIIVKSNILNLLAHRPTVSIEKAFSKSFSTEVSFVQGEFNNFLLTDHYDYKGFLLRAKKHFVNIRLGQVSPYTGIYIGNLKRNIQSEGYVDNTGFVSYPDRDFSANSIRGGGSLGLSYFTKSYFIFDTQSSLGYGRYLNIDKNDPNTYNMGYLDIQLWFSIGYCF